MPQKIIAVLILAFSFFLWSMSPVNTQEDKKSLKQELKPYKKMKPADVRNLKLSLDAQIADLTQNNEMLQALVKHANQTADSVQKEMGRQRKEYQVKLADTENRLKSLETELTEKKTEETGFTEGVLYKVQIGAFKFFSMKSALTQLCGVSFEAQEGFNKYVIGSFSKYADAYSFKKDIQRVGIRKAWIVSYKDGQRIDVKEALKLSGEAGSQ